MKLTETLKHTTKVIFLLCSLVMAPAWASLVLNLDTRNEELFFTGVDSGEASSNDALDPNQIGWEQVNWQPLNVETIGVTLSEITLNLNVSTSSEAIAIFAFGVPEGVVNLSADGTRVDYSIMQEEAKTILANSNGITLQLTNGSDFDSISVAVITIDTDGDGVDNATDNCVLVSNTNQIDLDPNGIGDVCEENDSPLTSPTLLNGAFSGQYNWSCGGGGSTDINFSLNQLSGESEISGTATYLGDTVPISGFRCQVPSIDNFGFQGCNEFNAVGDFIQIDIPSSESHVNNSFYAHVIGNGFVIRGRTINGDGVTGALPGCSEPLNTAGDFSVTAISSDGDTIIDLIDNCPLTENENQLDSDGNGVGDVCEPASNELCAPIKTTNGNLALICL